MTVDLGSLEDLSLAHAPANLDRTGTHGQDTQHPDLMSPSHPDRFDIALPSRDHFLKHHN